MMLSFPLRFYSCKWHDKALSLTYLGLPWVPTSEWGKMSNGLLWEMHYVEKNGRKKLRSNFWRKIVLGTLVQWAQQSHVGNLDCQKSDAFIGIHCRKYLEFNAHLWSLQHRVGRIVAHFDLPPEVFISPYWRFKPICGYIFGLWRIVGVFSVFKIWYWCKVHMIVATIEKRGTWRAVGSDTKEDK